MVDVEALVVDTVEILRVVVEARREDVDLRSSSSLVVVTNEQQQQHKLLQQENNNNINKKRWFLLMRIKIESEGVEGDRE